MLFIKERRPNKSSISTVKYTVRFSAFVLFEEDKIPPPPPNIRNKGGDGLVFYGLFGAIRWLVFSRYFLMRAEGDLALVLRSLDGQKRKQNCIQIPLKCQLQCTVALLLAWCLYEA